MKSCFKCASNENCSTYNYALGLLTPLCGCSGLERKKAEDFITEQLKCAGRLAMGCASYVNKTKKGLK